MLMLLLVRLNGLLDNLDLSRREVVWEVQWSRQDGRASIGNQFFNDSGDRGQTSNLRFAYHIPELFKQNTVLRLMLEEERT